MSPLSTVALVLRVMIGAVMSDARQPPKSLGTPGKLSAASPKPSRPARPAVKTPHETASVVGETIVGPPKDASPAAPAGAPASTVIMAGGPYAGLLGPPEAEGELGRLGGYAVLRELGRGGMGLVFEAEDLKLRRRVALKVMLPDFAKQPEAKERFLREARSAAAVEHDNIVPVYQVGEEHGVPFLAMRLLPGESLSDLLARKGSLPAVSVAGLGRQAALGLAAAHERGLIHRDIKPGNLWVESGGRVRVLDFGLARPQEAVGELTRSGAVVGTPEYLAPEQLRGEDLDGRADLFSLGAVLYRAATGTSPFRRDTLYGTLKAVESEIPPDPRTLRPDLPGPLAELIVKLLAKDRDQRPASASAAAKAFKELASAVAKSGEGTPTAAPSAKRQEVSQTAVLATAVADRPAVPVPGPPNPSLTPTAGPTAFPVFEPPPVLPSRVALRKPTPNKPASKPKRKAAAGSQPPWKSRNVQLAAGGGFVGLLGVIFAITLSTGDATVTINSFTNDVEVIVKQGGAEVVILDPETNATAELDPGTYELTLKGGSGVGFTARLEESSITLSRGDERLIEVLKETKPAGGIGEGGYALDFDGRAAYVHLPTLKLPDGPFTMEAWVLPRTESNLSIVAAAAGPVRTSLFRVGSAAGFRRADAARRSVVKEANGSSRPGARMHLAGVWDGTRVSLFVNGRPAPGPPEWPYAPFGDPTLVESMIGGKRDQEATVLAADGLFDGVIDEVRFSTVARYAGEFTPRQWFEPDEHTLALYHFDEGSGSVAKDSSGNGHEGKIVAARWVSARDVAATGSEIASPAPAEDSPRYALRFDGVDDEVRTPVEVGGSGDFTVEAWVVVEKPSQYGTAVGSRWLKLRTTQFTDRGYRWTGVIGGIDNGQEGHHAWVAAEPVEPGRRVHVALVRRGKGLRMFVNGRVAGEPQGWGEGAFKDEVFDVPLARLRIGLDGTVHHFNGIVDEVRISSIGRYVFREDFTPAERFEPDADTLALYHFDEGQGDVLKDASGNGRDAKILDATWVPEDGHGSEIATATDGWIDLLPLVDLSQEPPVSGDWSREGLALVSPTGAPREVAALAIPVEIRGGFELRAEFTLRKGDADIQISFPAESSSSLIGANSFSYSGPIGKLGFAFIDGKLIDKAGTAVDHSSFRPGERHTLDLRVEPAGGDVTLVARLDGKTESRWTGSIARLTGAPQESGYRPGRLGLATSWTRYVIHELRIRPLTGGTVRPAAQSAVRNAGVAAGWKPLFEPAQGLPAGTVRATEGTVTADGDAIRLTGKHCGYYPDVSAKDCVVRAELELLGPDAGDGPATASAGIGLRSGSNGRGYGIHLSPTGLYKLATGHRRLTSGRLAAPPHGGKAVVAIAAVGDRITGYIDGVKVAEATDAAHREGGPQAEILGVATDCKIRNFEMFLLDGTGLTPEQALGLGGGNGTAGPAGGFTDLLADPTLAKWTALSTPGNSRAGPGDWALRDGVLECTTSRNPGWLRYNRRLTDFGLDLEFFVPPGGNSGVLIRHSGEEPLPEHGMEIQIHDAAPGGPADQQTGAIYAIVAASPTDRMKRGEWNQMSIICRGEQVAVTVNGAKVVDVAVAKVPALAGRPRSGFIGLYNYAGLAAGTKFRNVRLRELP